MYAIVEIAGQQFKVAKDQKVYVHRLKEKEGSKVSFDKVFLLDNEGAVTVGAPVIEGAEVTAKILGHLKDDKVIVFKKKRRKGYKVKRGHRQALTEIQVESIIATGAKKTKKKEEPKKEAPKKEKKVKEVKKETPKTKTVTGVSKKSSKKDDLKKIEGVGPKAAEALNNAGLLTFADVAKSDSEKIKEILVEASSRLAHLVTDTWPKQAGLAAEGKWEELKELQERLDGGIEK